MQVLSNEPLNTEKQIALTPAKVQEFVSGTFTNNGFILVADTELDDGFLYKTSEHATTTQRPKLVVQYTLPQGQAPLRLLADTEGKGLLASLRSPVSRLNPGKAHLASYALQPLQQSGFPAASVLDAFDRANGSIGSSWSGSASGYSISSNRMDVGTGGPLYWNGTSFGADQEAYVTLTNVDPDGNEQDLLLKSQSASSWGSGMIEVIYKAGSVQVWTYHSSQGWVKRGENLVTFSSGDQVSTSSTRRFGARAKANGDVEVYKTCIEFIEITVYCRER